MSETRLILASASPRRRELLAQIGMPFEVIVSGLEENPWPGEKPASYSLRNAGDKAREVLGRVTGDAVIIAADTIVVLGERILEKPRDADDACAMLRSLSNAEHEVITGLTVLSRRGDDRRLQGDAVRTAVRFREISEAEISAYVATGEPMDKAGAYAIQGGAKNFVTEIRGSYTNVVGLPVDELKNMLAMLQ
jgi:septum formation protein